MSVSSKRRVAIVGGGVSGLACAWHLHVNCKEEVEVHLFEASSRLGGHAYTIPIETSPNKSIPVDIGFMVFNDDNYPNMTQWFQSLQVATEPTDMSLSVSLDQGNFIEWSSNSLFANKLQMLSPSFYTRFLYDMIRFNREAGKILLIPHEDDPRKVITVGQYLRQEGYSEEFAMYYLLPMMAALWSASIGNVLNFPISQLVGFMSNHKMLQIFNRPEWKTVAGRSQVYVERMLEILGDHSHLSCPITSLRNTTNPPNGSSSYELFSNCTSVGVFDDVVFATHAPDSVGILKDSHGIDTELLQVLGNIEYDMNLVYVHSDPALMPKRKSAWSSWNCMGKSELLRSSASLNLSKTKESFEGGSSGFGNTIQEETTKLLQEDVLEGEDGRMKAVYVTYYLNMLQNLKSDVDIFVSLNPHQKPNPRTVYRKEYMAHPQFTPQTLQAREKIAKKFQGKDGLWFCGAWQGYGFHEDGCRSGFQVATEISVTSLPWCQGLSQKFFASPDFSSSLKQNLDGGFIQKIYRAITYTLPVFISKRMITMFLASAIKKGSLVLVMNDGSKVSFGDGTPCGCDHQPVTLRIFDDWFFVKVAMEYDLGLARSYMAGFFNVQPLTEVKLYDRNIRPLMSRDETNIVLGDPVGLTRLFYLFIGNRDSNTSAIQPRRSFNNHNHSSAFTNAAGLLLAQVGSFFNFVRYKLTMDNSERGGSLRNIHAHYDLSNDLFRTFLDKETLMYSSSIYDAIKVSPSVSESQLVFRGTLEQAQWRKLDTLLNRAQVQKGQTILDIGFGWGGLSLHAAKKYGCHVTGITLSVEQKALAEERVRKEGLGHLITFEVIDYRTFARKAVNRQKFDRVLSCEMIEAVGHSHLVEFFWAVEQVLAPNGILVMEAITTPECRYENYLRTTDFINTIIFPGSCCPSLHALVDASYKGSTLTLEHIDNIGLHYAETLREWRRRFNANETIVRKMGFDDIFMRAWNYYFTYCEAGFSSQTENCLIIVFSRPGCRSLTPLSESRSVTQQPIFTDEEVSGWLSQV